ncbi:MAG: hypothetical protein HY866_11210 [Chloroflexi bacterium]|nr:hypothetical protein [Chloroflexota bacterium]
MKNGFRRVSIIGLLLVIGWALPLVVHAQQGDNINPAALAIPPAIYYQPVSGGSFVANADESYRLTLQGVPQEMLRFAYAPALEVRHAELDGFITSWSLAQGLVGNAVLDVNGLNIYLFLSDPRYDGSALSYRAEIDQIVVWQPTKDEPALPETFDSAHLSIAATTEFQMARAAAIIDIAEGVRFESDLSEGCEEARAAIETDSAALPGLVSQAETAGGECMAGKASSCTLWQHTNTSIQQTQTHLTESLDYFASACGAE